MRFSRPVYEGLPWLYMLCGLSALVLSYVQQSQALSLLIGLPGLLALLGGIVVFLRRRDYRDMRERYARPDALSEPAKEK